MVAGLVPAAAMDGHRLLEVAHPQLAINARRAAKKPRAVRFLRKPLVDLDVHLQAMCMHMCMCMCM